MSRFSVWITQPRGWSHARMFLEVADSLAHSLRELGHEVSYAPGRGALVEPPPAWGRKDFGRPIVLAPNFLIDCPLDPSAILWNFEQVPAETVAEPGTLAAQLADAWLRHDVLRLMCRHTVWDYSAINVERLRRLGVEDVRHVRVGFSPVLVRISSPWDAADPPEEDVDVLFYGTVREGDRRHAVLKALEARGLRVLVLTGVYGEERDRAIARSKIVLCLHHNPPEVLPAIWEVVRCSYLMANKRCVVSEAGGQDPELEALAWEGTARVAYDDIVDTCAALARDPLGRRAVANAGFDAITRIDQVAEVAHALFPRSSQSNDGGD